MSKMSIADASVKLGISKEAIHNRIRRGSLECVVENGEKFVLLDSIKASSRRAVAKKTNYDENYFKFLEAQNEKLQARVDKLEDETRLLRDQKELMLIAEKKKIEDIYKQKDEQLKSILSAISSQFMLNTSQTKDIIAQEVEVVEVEQDKIVNEPISLNKYLKKSDFSKKKKEKIKARFKKKAKKDNRIIILGDKYYINLDKYDYKDLLK